MQKILYQRRTVVGYVRVKIVKFQTFLKIKCFKVQGHVKWSGESEKNGKKILRPKNNDPTRP